MKNKKEENMNKNTILTQFFSEQFNNKFISRTASISINKKHQSVFGYSMKSWSIYKTESDANLFENKRISNEVRLFYSNIANNCPINKENITPYNVDTIDSFFKTNIAKNKNVFVAFKDATWGNGNEWMDIRTVHSSALCGFLHFWKLIKGERLFISKKYFNVEYGGEDKFLIFNKAYFELKNKCIRFPSCLDVVLISEDQKYILFLELKFSEYLDSECAFSKSYFNKYKGILFDKTLDIEHLNNNSIKICENLYLSRKFSKKLNSFINDSQRYLTFESGDDKIQYYTYGIKQMMSHYIGINNFISSGVHHPSENRRILEMSPTEIKNKIKNNEIKCLYGEMVFDFSKNFEGEDKSKERKFITNKYNYFNEAYKAITNKLSSLENNKIIFADHILTYQEVFCLENNKNLLTDEIKKFYKY